MKKLDYWMYPIIIKALNEKLKQIAHKYNIDVAKGNRWSTYGQYNLCAERLREMHEEYDRLIQDDIQRARESSQQVEER